MIVCSQSISVYCLYKISLSALNMLLFAYKLISNFEAQIKNNNN